MFLMMPEVRAEPALGHPHRFLSLTLVVLPCHTTFNLVPDSSGLSSDTTTFGLGMSYVEL